MITRRAMIKMKGILANAEGGGHPQFYLQGKLSFFVSSERNSYKNEASSFKTGHQFQGVREVQYHKLKSLEHCGID